MNIRKLKNFPFNNLFYNCVKYNFARTQKIVPIYPGDPVVVLPPWKNSKLNRNAQKFVKTLNEKISAPQYGLVIKVYRKKGLVSVRHVNKERRYTDPRKEKFFRLLEKDMWRLVKKKVVYVPVKIDRVKLVDKITRKIIQTKFIKDEAGLNKRINVLTNKEVPIKRKLNRSYEERTKEKIDGPKDTSTEIRSIKTYSGENFEKIAKLFIDKIKKKEEIESNLVLKD